MYVREREENCRDVIMNGVHGLFLGDTQLLTWGDKTFSKVTYQDIP